jgi:hypothetical protein
MQIENITVLFRLEVFDVGFALFDLVSSSFRFSFSSSIRVSRSSSSVSIRCNRWSS